MYCTEFKYRNIFSRYHLCFNYSKTLARSAVPREFQSHAPFFSPGQVNTKVFHLKWNSFNRVFPCPRLLYGALVSTNFWNPKHIGFSSLQTDGGYKVLSFIHRNYSSAYVLTSPCISRYWSGSNLAATQSSVLGWFLPLPFFFFSTHCYPVCVLPDSFWTAFKISTGIPSYTSSFLGKYHLEQNQKPLTGKNRLTGKVDA